MSSHLRWISVPDFTLIRQEQVDQNLLEKLTKQIDIHTKEI